MFEKADAPPQTLRLQAIVLSADDQRESDLARLPEGGKAVLDELRSVLVFRNFQVLGVASVLSSGGAVQLEIAKRFRVQMLIDNQRRSDQTIFVRDLKVLVDDRGGPVIDTALTMPLGEPVVVGASSVEGGKQALVLLLSARPLAGESTGGNGTRP